MAAVPDFHLIAVFVGWFVLNIGLSYYNSYVLSHTNFRYAFLLTLINKVVGFFVAITLMLVRRGLPKPGEVLGQFLRPMVHVQGVMTALNIGLNNWSLVFISLTMNQVLRSTVPLPTAALSMLLEGKYFSWHLWASMLLLISGCVLAAWGAMGNEPILGILVALGSVFATAMWTVTSAILMQTGAKPLDSVSLLFVAGPTCMVTLGIFFCVQDLPRLANFQPDPEHPVPPVHMMVLYLGVAAAMASAYDIVHNEFVKITSSLNMAIMGNSKVHRRAMPPMVPRAAPLRYRD